MAAESVCKLLLHSTEDVECAECSAFCSKIALSNSPVFQLHNWLKFVSYKFATATQGAVHRGVFIGHVQVCVKQFKCSESFYRERNAGECCLRVPFFAETLASWTRPSDGAMFTMTKYEEGAHTLSSVLPSIGPKMFSEICLQLCCALELAQDAFRFGHNDMHCNNILLVPNNGKIIECILDEYKVVWKNMKQSVRILDFGMSTCTLANGKIVYGPSGLENYGIRSRLQPGSDMFMFLQFVRQSTSVKRSVISLIDSWFSEFYQFDRSITHVAELQRGNRPASYRTPKALFNHIITTVNGKYMTDVRLEPTDRVTNTELLKDRNSYIDSLLAGDRSTTTESINYDIRYFQNTMIHATCSSTAVQKLFAIRQLGIDLEPYRQWVKRFQDSIQFNKYWSDKIRVDEIVRYVSWAKLDVN